MLTAIALLVGGVALYALAGSALSGRTMRETKARSRIQALRVLPLALAEALALVSLGGGVDVVDGELDIGAVGLPLWLLAALCVTPAGLLAVGLVVLAVFPPASGGDDGPGPDDLPPPSDPEGPDGWAEFEREFRAYAGAHDARRSAELLR